MGSFPNPAFLQLALQMSDDDDLEVHRLAALRLGDDTFDRQEGFDMVRWVAYHGFGTYMHFVKGFLSEETQAEAKQAQAQLVKRAAATGVAFTWTPSSARRTRRRLPSAFSCLALGKETTCS